MAIDTKTADAYTLKTQSADAIAYCDKKIYEDLLREQKLKEELQTTFNISDIVQTTM